MLSGAVSSRARSESAVRPAGPALAFNTGTVIVPDLKDLDIPDAEQAVHNVGLSLSVTGIGVVVSQAPRAGTAVQPGSIIHVYLPKPKLAFACGTIRPTVEHEPSLEPAWTMSSALVVELLVPASRQESAVATA